MSSILKDKSVKFGVRTIKFCKSLKKEHVDIRSQVIRSSTSIGANLFEATEAASKKDFIYKLGLSLKEARETEFWIVLLRELDEYPENTLNDLQSANNELIKMLTSSILTVKKRYNL